MGNVSLIVVVGTGDLEQTIPPAHLPCQYAVHYLGHLGSSFHYVDVEPGAAERFDESPFRATRRDTVA